MKVRLTQSCFGLELAKVAMAAFVLEQGIARHKLEKVNEKKERTARLIREFERKIVKEEKTPLIKRAFLMIGDKDKDKGINHLDR